MPDDESLKQIAVIMTVNCVRNTCIENYHAQGKQTDPEMKAFNKEVTDRIYTFLEVLLGRPKDECEPFLNSMASLSGNALQTWDKPGFVRGMWHGKDYVPRFDPRFTPTEGWYMAFINHYTQLHGKTPAEAEIQEYFRDAPYVVQNVMLALEKKGLIHRTPGQAQAIKVLVESKDLPKLT